MKLKIKPFQPRRPPASERLTICCMLKARFSRKPGITTVDRTSSEMCTPQCLGADALRLQYEPCMRVERLKLILSRNDFEAKYRHVPARVGATEEVLS